MLSKQKMMIALSSLFFTVGCQSPYPPDKPMFYSFNGTHHINDLPSTYIPEVDEDVSPHGGPALSVREPSIRKAEKEDSKFPKRDHKS